MINDPGATISTDVEAMSQEQVREALLNHCLVKAKESGNSPYAQSVEASLRDTHISILREQLKRIMFLKAAERQAVKLFAVFVVSVIGISIAIYASIC